MLRASKRRVISAADASELIIQAVTVGMPTNACFENIMITDEYINK